MFLKTGELKKMMKAALKSGGLYVGNINGGYLVHAGTWGLCTDILYASNKFKAALMELIGDIPESGEYYRYYHQNGEVTQDAETDYPNAYEMWKEAKDYAAYVPINLCSWPHAFIVLQVHSDLSYKVADKSLTADVISSKELETTVEGMPGRPNYNYGILYWKNDTTIYWVHTTEAGEKAREVLFPSMEKLDFFQTDWRLREDNEPDQEADFEEELPY
ncbi:hypothetical protein ABFV83_02165 [Lacrimispora sp. BS-2]|uniref:Uncharacterized protein n=1 Tax=Lacrimispora sp. BS-2 TaxID=3151850 RepID=A0AAU7PQF7_9FIRM